MNKNSNFDIGLKKVINYLQNEIKKDGLLEDVTNVYFGIKTEYKPEPPYLWIIEEDIIISQEYNNISSVDYLNSPFRIFAVCYDSENVEESYYKSKSLAERAGKALENGHHNDENKWFRFIKFNSFSSTGIEIKDGSKRINQSSIVYDCIFCRNQICHFKT